MENALYIHSFSVLLTNGSKPAEKNRIRSHTKNYFTLYFPLESLANLASLFLVFWTPVFISPYFFNNFFDICRLIFTSGFIDNIFLLAKLLY